jgi:hypothetical protein
VQYGQTPEKHQACVIRGHWRLVHGDELYDVAADRAQRHNVAAERADVVARLRSDYEAWWAGVAPRLGDFVPQSIGAAEQPVVEFTSGDWEGIYADNVGFVRQAVGGPTGGRWHVRVERPGRYEFTLRRWPGHRGVPLGGADALLGPAAAKAVEKPRTFPTIAAAHLKIGGAAARTAADPEATGATIATTLAAGTTTMEAWFADVADAPLCGAFFVTVRRLE